MQTGMVFKLTDHFFNTTDDFLIHYPELSLGKSYRATCIRNLGEISGVVEMICVETSEKFNVHEVHRLPENEQPKAKWWAFITTSNPQEYEVLNADSSEA